MEQSGRPPRRRRHHQPHPPRRLRARPRPPRRRRRPRPQGPPVQLPGRGLHRGHDGGGAGDARRRRARGRRHRLGPARRRLPVAGRRPTGLAGRRAGGPPDAGRRRRARDLQRRQAARRPAGRHHRRPRRSGRRVRRPPPGPGAAARRARARRAAGRRAGLPAPRRRHDDPVLADGRAPGRRPRRSRRCRARRPGGAPALGARVAAVESLPGRRLAARHRDPVVGVAIDGDRTAELRGGRPARRRPRQATAAPSSTCAPSTRPTTPRSRRRWPPCPPPAREGRRHRRPRRPRQVVARAGPHRHRPGPLRGGEAARPDHRPRLRPHHAARRARRSASSTCPATSASCKNMLAGVGAVDACLFVVAATEGWKPQSEEHLRILELLGIGHGVVALDEGRPGRRRVAASWPAWTSADHVAGTFLETAPIVPVAAPPAPASTSCAGPSTGSSPPRRRPAIAAGPASGSIGCSPPRAAGTVVTGTLTGGALAVGDQVVVGPQSRPARIRAIQSLGRGRRAHRARPPRRAQPGRGRAHRGGPGRRRRRARAMAADACASTPR